MWTRYTQFESLEHLMASQLRPGGNRVPVTCVVFGGTGAVGGSTVLELCRFLLAARRYREEPFRGRIYATALGEREIRDFLRRVAQALEPEAELETLETHRHYRLGGLVDLHFDLLQLRVPEELAGFVERRLEGRAAEPALLEQLIEEYCDALPRPFQEYVEQLGHPHLLDGVVVAIPLPSVATYTLGAMDLLAERFGLGHDVVQRVKDHYLETFVRGLAVVQQKHSRHVVIAHTTGVGGMCTVDGLNEEIRTGFAHSSSGKLLQDKKYFADRLTRLYLDQGFDVLATAAAIGIDAVEFDYRLPVITPVRRVLTAAVDAEGDGFPVLREDLDAGIIRRYKPLDMPFGRHRAEGGDTEGRQAVSFGRGRELRVEAAIRSGENGLFSVANCTALYHVMKVAIPEELANVILRRVVFGRERRRSWFQEGLCYYTETENAHLAHRVLDSDQRLQRAHLGAFAVQAYQALGSSTHQARLHELGLVLLLLRLLQLRRRLDSFSDGALLDASADIDDFLWRHTETPVFEDFLDLGVPRLARLLGQLCEIRSKGQLAELLALDRPPGGPGAGEFAVAGARPGMAGSGQRSKGRERFLARMVTRIRRYLSVITSLGTPILYQSETHGQTRMLVGPYVAPLDLAVTHSAAVHVALERKAEDAGVSYETARDWAVSNNGFIDLRPHALGTDAKQLGPEAEASLLATDDLEQLRQWLLGLTPSRYFTTNGLLALDRRLRGLHLRLQTRHTELGTANTWKNLFFRRTDGKYVLSPGLVETCRMYTEGLGKVTGTELLWPIWGYWIPGLSTDV